MSQRTRLSRTIQVLTQLLLSIAISPQTVSPLSVSISYEKIEFYFISRQAKPIKTNYGEILFVWLPSITAGYLVIAVVFALYSLSFQKSALDQFQG